MPHSIIYNGKPIEGLEKPDLLEAIDVLCCQLEDCKVNAAYWEKIYKDSLVERTTKIGP